MSTVDKDNAMAALRAWQRELLERHGARPIFGKIGPMSVSALCYFYRPSEQVEDTFPYTACAIYETWRHCGRLKTNLIVNEPSPAVEKFQREHAKWVSVQVEPKLTPGSVDAMSVDCNSRLHTRFDTPYVLIIQDDGFPLRPGLERFLGMYDYVGSPFRRRNFLGRAAASLLRHCPANGGFSLRTKKICRLASEYWHKYYADKPFSPEQVEDIFYTDTLPKRFLSYRFRIRVADPRTASDFSYDGCLPENVIPYPFGFHSARAFSALELANEHG